MSYYYRHTFAKRFWREEDHPRGKTSEQSTPGSFAPHGPKFTTEVQAELRGVQQIGYRRLAEGHPYTRAAFEAEMQALMNDAVGPGFEAQTTEMAERIWREYHEQGPHQYYEPRSWKGPQWAVKTDVHL